MRRAVVAEGAYHLSQTIVVGSDGTCIAQRPEVLTRVETMPGSIAQGTCTEHLVLLNTGTAVGLRIVLDEFQAMPMADVCDTLGKGTKAVKMNYHHSPCTTGDGPLNQGIVHLERVDVRLYQHRLQATFRYSKNTGDKGVGRDDDLITHLHHTHLHIGPKYQRQSIEPVATTDTMPRTDILGILRLEPFRSLALQIPATIQHPIQRLTDFRVVQIVDSFQVKILDHRSY